MTTHKILSAATIPSRRRIYVSGLVVRMLIALVISWVVVMLFVTSVVSH